VIEVPEELTQEKKRVMQKVSDFLFDPSGIPDDVPERVDTQGDLSNNLIAEGVMYHRTMADRFKLLEGKTDAEDDEKGEKEKKGDASPTLKISDMITNFANRLSLLPWAAHRKSREEGVTFGRGMREEKPGLRLERLEDVTFAPPPEEEKKRFQLPR